jgi:hypothetical protein
MHSFSFIASTHRDMVISATPCSKATDACDFPSLMTTWQIFMAIMLQYEPPGRMAGDGRSRQPQRSQQSSGPPGAGVILIGRLAQAAGIVGAFCGAG